MRAAAAGAVCALWPPPHSALRSHCHRTRAAYTRLSSRRSPNPAARELLGTLRPVPGLHVPRGPRLSIVPMATQRGELGDA